MDVFALQVAGVEGVHALHERAAEEDVAAVGAGEEGGGDVGGFEGGFELGGLGVGDEGVLVPM